MIDKIRDAVGGSLADVTIGLWGLTFKADTDDLRDSPRDVRRSSPARGRSGRARVRPRRRRRPRQLAPGIELCADAYEAAEGADAVALLTEWDEFRWLDFDRVHEVMRGRAIVDARNLLDPAAMRRRGFAYQGVGRR